MNEISTARQENALALSDNDVLNVLSSSIYPGANLASIKLAIMYCKANNLDIFQKPVHLVPMWDKNSGTTRDVIMPGIGLYRTQASRTGEFAGLTEPEFGPMITETIEDCKVTYPEFCKITAKRVLSNGVIAEFTAIEYWTENYAVKGGKEKSIAPNAMWQKRPRAQLVKCTEAQAMRKAFPEMGAAPTAEEMEGKNYDIQDNQPLVRRTPQEIVNAQIIESTPERDGLITDLEIIVTEQGLDAYGQTWEKLTKEQRQMVGIHEHQRLKELGAKNDCA
jgi:phage recombination protein Bet